MVLINIQGDESLRLIMWGHQMSSRKQRGKNNNITCIYNRIFNIVIRPSLSMEYSKSAPRKYFRITKYAEDFTGQRRQKVVTTLT